MLEYQDILLFIAIFRDLFNFYRRTDKFNILLLITISIWLISNRNYVKVEEIKKKFEFYIIRLERTRHLPRKVVNLYANKSGGELGSLPASNEL